MKTSPCLVLSLILILLGSGCQHAATPSLSTQQKFFESLRAANPEEEAALRCAQYHNLIGRFDQALQELSKAVASDPHNARLLNAMGNCYDNLGQYARAQEIYERILEQNGDKFFAKNNLGYSCYLSGDFGRAEKIFQEILSRNPEDTVARNNLGLLWCRQGKESEAMGLWQKTEGEILAREKLAQVLASLGKSGKLVANHAPKNDLSQQAAVLPDQAGRTEKAPRQTASGLRENKPATPSASNSIAKDSPAISAPGPNPVNLTGKIIPKPQVKTEEVKMIIHPATYTETTTAATVAKQQSSASLASPPQNEKLIPGVKYRPLAKECVLDEDLLQDEEDEVETPNPRHYYRRPRQWPRYPKPQIITINPPSKESQSIKKCLSQEIIYQNLNSSGKQEPVF